MVTTKITTDLNPDIKRLLNYLSFKMSCAAYQEANPIRFDRDLAVRSLETLYKQKEEKVEELVKVMPRLPDKVSKANRPKVTHKKDGTPSAKFTQWMKLLRERGLPPTYNKTIETTLSYKDANPGSSDQVKAWLFSLGWEPCTFDYKKSEDGSERKIPQVRKDGELTPSVLRLVDKEPKLEALAGLTVIQHRIGVFEGFLSSAIEKGGKWYLKAEIAGLTNTLRFKHKKPLVNLPGVDKPWGKEIRGCLIADDGEVFIGADMVSLEDTTKRHYMMPHDPDYVEEMSQEGYDPHLSLALFAGEITQEDYETYDGEVKWIKDIRKAYKVTNYSAVYGVGSPKLSREMGVSRKKAQALLDAYWQKNWAVKKVASEQEVKTVGGKMWLRNPVSGFYYELRFDKDRFSTLNQGTGVYIFDSWLARARVLGYMGSLQFHDETGASVTDESHTREVLYKAVEMLNNDLTLSVEIKVDMASGSNYAEVH